MIREDIDWRFLQHL